MDENDLLARIDKLEKWMQEKTAQQISYPLDQQSLIVLGKYFMHIVGSTLTIGGAAGNTFLNYIGEQDNQKFQVSTDTFVQYAVNVSTDTLTTINSGVNFANNTQIYVSTESTPPSPLSLTGNYFIINSTGQSFKLSLTSGGAAINITDVGVGKQYIYFF